LNSRPLVVVGSPVRSAGQQSGFCRPYRTMLTLPASAD